MKFFMDFEATRFSNRVISIGCVAENGNTFQTLVNPGKKKVDKFITELTGITNEMLETAPSADEAFVDFYNYMVSNFDGEVPEYYVYGNCDSSFLHATARKMSNPLAITFAQALAGNLIDYASVVKKFFVAPSDLALRKVYMLVQDEKDLVQKHDALEDALMLQTVVAGLHNKCKPEDKATIMAMPSQKRPKVGGGAPEIFQKWNQLNSPKWSADTLADEECWCVKCTCNQSGKIKYFDSFNTAALWLIRYYVRNKSPKKAEEVQKIEQTIKTAVQNKKSRYGFAWEYNPEGAIAAAAKEDNE